MELDGIQSEFDKELILDCKVEIFFRVHLLNKSSFSLFHNESMPKNETHVRNTVLLLFICSNLKKNYVQKLKKEELYAASASSCCQHCHVHKTQGLTLSQTGNRLYDPGNTGGQPRNLNGP